MTQSFYTGRYNFNVDVLKWVRLSLVFLILSSQFVVVFSLAPYFLRRGFT